MGVGLDERIVRKAETQHGVVARWQLLEAGLTRGRIDGAVRSGRLARVHPGVYILGSLQGGLMPPRARPMAAVLAGGPGAVLSYESAGLAWRILPRPTGPPRAAPPIHITIPHTTRRLRGRPGGLVVHRAVDLPAADVTRVDGIPTTTPGRTLRDLSAVLSVRELNRAAARAERRGLIETGALPALVARHGARPGAPVLRAALLRDPELTFTRSEAEERFADLVAAAELPRPRVNAVVAGFEVDFYWDRVRVAVEVDGFAHHRSRGSFEGDHRRDAAIQAAGITVLRLTWRQVVEESVRTAVQLARVLDAAAR